jgi:hypothetical protein
MEELEHGDVQLDLINPFSAAYVRNNKSKTKKNMRCFPQCCAAGHNMKGFCGMPIRMRVSSCLLDRAELGSLTMLGGIQCDKEKRVCTVGDLIDVRTLEQCLESNELIKGTPVAYCGDFSGVYEISPGTRKGWTYNWNNNSCRGKVCHYFSVLCFRHSPSNPGFLECVGQSSSRGFEVCSSKRAAPGMTSGTVEKKITSRKRPKASQSTPYAQSVSFPHPPKPFFYENNTSLTAPLQGHTSPVPVTVSKQLHVQQLQQLQYQLQQLNRVSAQGTQPSTTQRLQQLQLQQLQLQQLQQQQQQQHGGFATNFVQIQTGQDNTHRVAGARGDFYAADPAKEVQSTKSSFACSTTLFSLPRLSSAPAPSLEGTVVFTDEEIKPRFDAVPSTAYNPLKGLLCGTATYNTAGASLSNVASVCGAFDQMELEKEITQKFIDLFHYEGDEYHGCAQFADECKKGGTAAGATRDVQDLFETVYGANGFHQRIFYKQIRDLAQANAEKLRAGKLLYEASTLAGLMNGCDDGIAVEQSIVSTIQKFTALGLKQLEGLCELHASDLSRWLANPRTSSSVCASTPIQEHLSLPQLCARQVLSLSGILSSDSDGDASQCGRRLVDAESLHCGIDAAGFGIVERGHRRRIVAGGGFVQPHSPHSSASDTWKQNGSSALKFSFLRHIGRVEPELNFLASLAELAVDDEQDDSYLPLHPPIASEATEISSVFEGVYEIHGKQNRNNFDRLLGLQGYPWFIRQIVTRVMSALVATSTDDQLIFSAHGTFFGHIMTDVKKRVPPMCFSYRPRPQTETKWKLEHRGVGNSCMAKLAYRFVNMHTNVVGNDGICFSEHLGVDPKFFFGSGTSMQDLFDTQEMKDWSVRMNDVDENGLPKSMLREQWNRRQMKQSLRQHSGETYLDNEMTIFEYDPSTDDWTRIRCKILVSYKQLRTPPTKTRWPWPLAPGLS